MLKFGCAVNEELRDRRLVKEENNARPGQRTRAHSDMQLARKRIRRRPSQRAAAGLVKLSGPTRAVTFATICAFSVPA